MPISIEVVTTIQTCTRIGATHSMVFGNFSTKNLQERIINADTTEVITADKQFRSDKEIPLKPAMNEAIAMDDCEKVKNVIIYQRTNSNVKMTSSHNK